MPLGAMVARAELLEAWGPGAHGSTYGGNPVACAAALATIELLEGGLVENAADARRAGARRVSPAASSASTASISDVRGKGLMIGVEFDTAEHAEEVQWACFERGLLVLECGKSQRPDVAGADRQRGRDGDRAADLRRGGRGRRRRRPAVLAEVDEAGALHEVEAGRLTAHRRPIGDTSLTSKVASMRDAIADLVRDGDTVAIEGFTHLICFAAGHEIIRQRRRDLTLARLTPDLIYDQMIAGGVARKLVFSWLGNPGVGRDLALDPPTDGAEPADARIAEPREDQLARDPGGDHLVVDEVGRQPGQRQVALALADDLVTGGEADEVREALDGDRVAVADEVRDGIAHRGDLGAAHGTIMTSDRGERWAVAQPADFDPVQGARLGDLRQDRRTVVGDRARPPRRRSAAPSPSRPRRRSAPATSGR